MDSVVVHGTTTDRLKNNKLWILEATTHRATECKATSAAENDKLSDNLHNPSDQDLFYGFLGRLRENIVKGFSPRDVVALKMLAYIVKIICVSNAFIHLNGCYWGVPMKQAEKVSFQNMCD